MSDLVSSLYYGIRRFLRPRKRGVLAVGDALDRARHPARHRAARAAVAALRPRSVLFVCLGNVCRSPYAEWAVRDALEARGVAVASAGFIGPGRAPPDMAQAVARKRGVEHAASRSMLVTPEVLAETDLALVFDQGHARRRRRMGGATVVHMADLDPVWRGRRTIADPWGGSEEDFERAFDRIDAALATLAADVPTRAPELADA